MSRFTQATADEGMPLGLGLIALVLIGSLWGCIGFLAEWAGIQAGLPEAFAHRLFRGIGFGTAGFACAMSAWWIWRERSWRLQAAVGICLYGLLLWLTPRSFTYDTGLYHLPLINHLNQIGLEWNLGWLHSRYAFFNLLLYGQSALSRLAGTVALPSLNGFVLTGTLLFLSEHVKRNSRALVPSIVVTGALLLPSESTESFHSFNADFSLGCVFLVTCILITSNSPPHGSRPFETAALSAFFPLIKLSGLFLLPTVLAGYVKQWSWRELGRNIKTLVPLLVLLIITSCGFGFITAGYLSYPVAATGPLRADAISKNATIRESKLSTTAWARFAYSDQLDSIRADASPGEWMPKWSRSLNGQRMLVYTALSLISTCISLTWARQSPWTPVLIANTGFWILAILVLPPDPRFYFGPILLTLYGSTCWIYRRKAKATREEKQLSRIFIVASTTIIVFTSLWRDSDTPRNTFPVTTGVAHGSSKGFYNPRLERAIIHPTDGTCWTLPAPCHP